jgi:hypothetical protein
MSDKLANNFLSKENISQLYKQVIMNNDFTNLTKQQKDFIIGKLIENMKRIFKTLDYTKINEKNLLNIKQQYNSIVIKQTADLVKNSMSNADNSNNNKNIERTFNSIKVNVPTPIGIDRPTSSHSTQAIPMKVSEEYIKKTSGDLSSRLAELENSRRTNNQPPVQIPDFLKPTKVGKENPYDNINNNVMPERKLEGLNDMHDNFKENAPNVDISKYSDNMSVQDRLKKLEAERGMPVSGGGPNTNNNINSMFNQQTNVSAMFSNTIPSSQSNPPNNQYQSPPSQNNQYQSPQQLPQQPPQQIPPTQYQPPVPSVDPQLLQQLNEMKQLMNSLKYENEHLKNQMMNKKSIRTLQLDINKTQSKYNFQFNPINKIVGLKLLSYNLPQPIYNIFDVCHFIYKINEIEQHIVIPKGNYQIDSLLNCLNNNNDLIFSIDFTQKVSIKSKDENAPFQILPTYISFKLGFINTPLLNLVVADKLYDLRLPSKLSLYVKNINSTEPLCILNFNNNSICNLQFQNPLSLSNLDLEFHFDNVLYNFNDLHYNLSFALDIIED